MRNKFSKIALVAGFGLALAFTFSCSSDGGGSPSPKKTVKKEKISGVSQKGPFVSGTVILYELDENNKRTKKSFSGAIGKNGGYEITEIKGYELASPYVELEATGKYINEITNVSSKSNITLKAIVDITDKDNANINVLTHLEHDKVLNLVKNGLSFADAKSQALGEVLQELGLDGIALGKNSEDINILGKTSADSVLLLASVLVQGSRSESELGALLTTLDGIGDVKNGKEQALEDVAKAKDNLGLTSSNSSSSGDNVVSSSSAYNGSSSSSSVNTPVVGEWVVTIPATCDSAGLETRINELSQTETRPIAKLDWSEWSVTPATCETAGVRTRTCPNNASPAQTEQIAKLDYVWTETTPATCKKAGVKTGTCPGNVSPDKTQEIAKLEYKATEYCSNGVIKQYGTVTDGSGNSYKTVVIGTQTWMAENLKHNVAGSKCGDVSTWTLSDDNTDDCDEFGRLYEWATAMALPDSCNIKICATQIAEKHQGICPSGWHIPSNADWDILLNYVESYVDDMRDPLGKYLLETYDSDPHNEDRFGFAALLGGYGYVFGGTSSQFKHLGTTGVWLSATENNDNAYGSFLIRNTNYIHLGYEVKYDDAAQKDFMSVRCLK